MKPLTSALAISSVWLILLAAPIEPQTTGKGKIGTHLTVTAPGNWRAIQKGVEYRRVAFERSEPSSTFELKLLRLDAKIIVAKVLTAADFQLKSANAKTFVEKGGAFAAVNANYFDDKGRALAYLKTGTQEINRNLSKHALYTGVFAVRNATPVVLHRDDFQPAQAGEALQAGPLLLKHGAPVDIMNGLGRYARRTVVGIDKEGRIIVGVTDAVIGGLSFAELQELFSNAKWQLDTPDLLNLDGGGSAQFYVKSGKFEEFVAGTAEVPVAIGFYTKSN
jgi:exopolysaccharide biosynthesis protein